uniref:C-type lectin domain-containing protein n=1 Tax=Denticeps clupeoides TaxID=299321 RepID=A0AAY4A6T0_9TELE
AEQNPDKNSFSLLSQFMPFMYVTPFLLNVSGTWAESLHNCISPSAEMLSISNSNIQQQMAQNLEPSGDPKEAWIGLRRRLLNEEWYWLNRNPVVFTNWAANEPKGSMDGMCATVSLGPSGIFSWHSRSCCLSLQAIYYFLLLLE